MSDKILNVEEVYTAKEVAKILKCKEATVKGIMDAKKITFIKVGRERRIRGFDLQNFINQENKKKGKR